MEIMTREKEFSKLEQQVTIQSDRRHLRIRNHKKAIKYFATNNYFNVINGFESLILDDTAPTKHYSKNKSIEDFKRCFSLDKFVSRQLYTEISKVEIELKSRIAYYFCKEYCKSGASDNLKYQHIDCYNIPVAGSGAPKYIDYFYNLKPNKDVDNSTSHKLFKRYNKKGVVFQKIHFTGAINVDSTNNRFIHLKGTFIGVIKGLKTNEYTGVFKVDTSQHTDLLKFSKTKKTSEATNLLLRDVTGVMQSLNFSDNCKIQYPYISSYKSPPFWVIINTLMLNDLMVLFHGLDSEIQNKIIKRMGNFDINDGGKEEFINALEILIELRNVVAHYGLVTRYRTTSNLTINANLIRRLNLYPKTKNKVLRFYDVVKVLSQFESFSSLKIRRASLIFLITNKLLLKDDINHRFSKRVGTFRDNKDKGILLWRKFS